MTRLLRLLAGAIVVALGTWFAGWTMPIGWGMLLGLARPYGRPARLAAVHGSLGWALVLAFMAMRGDPVGVLATRLAGAMQVPASALFLATLLYPALLASCAAWLAAQLRTATTRHDPGGTDAEWNVRLAAS